MWVYLIVFLKALCKTVKRWQLYIKLYLYIFVIFYSGGQGRRRLNLVPPESEGYCGSTIRCATGGGKTMIYIVPLQDEFDLSPLPSDAQEFSLMPKAECKKCYKIMPLQILALHVRECDALECETLSDSEPEVIFGWVTFVGCICNFLFKCNVFVYYQETDSPPAFEEKVICLLYGMT